jgi:hypothetical protein
VVVARIIRHTRQEAGALTSIHEVQRRWLERFVVFAAWLLLVSWAAGCDKAANSRLLPSTVPTHHETAAQAGVSAPVDTSGGEIRTGSWQVKGRTEVGNGTLNAAQVAPDQVAGTSTNGITPAGHPVRLALNGAKLGEAVITFHRDKPVPKGDLVALAYLDEKTKTWEPVPTKVSKDRMTLTAHTNHFSIWDVLGATFGSIISTRVDQPECSTKLPKWAKAVDFVDDANTPLRWCAGRDSKDSDRLVVKIAANRSYGFFIRPTVRPTRVAYPGLGGGVDALTWGLDGFGATVTGDIQPLHRRALLPPGAEINLTFTKKDLAGLSDGDTLIRVTASVAAAFGGIAYSGV